MRILQAARRRWWHGNVENVEKLVNISWNNFYAPLPSYYAAAAFVAHPGGYNSVRITRAHQNIHTHKFQSRAKDPAIRQTVCQPTNRTSFGQNKYGTEGKYLGRVSTPMPLNGIEG